MFPPREKQRCSNGRRECDLGLVVQRDGGNPSHRPPACPLGVGGLPLNVPNGFLYFLTSECTRQHEKIKLRVSVHLLSLEQILVAFATNWNYGFLLGRGDRLIQIHEKLLKLAGWNFSIRGNELFKSPKRLFIFFRIYKLQLNKKHLGHASSFNSKTSNCFCP